MTYTQKEKKRKDGAHTCPFVSHINVSFSMVSTAAVAELESHELFKGIYSPELRRWDGGDDDIRTPFYDPITFTTPPPHPFVTQEHFLTNSQNLVLRGASCN